MARDAERGRGMNCWLVGADKSPASKPRLQQPSIGELTTLAPPKAVTRWQHIEFVCAARRYFCFVHSPRPYQAGRLAGQIRHRGGFALLVPRELDPVAAGTRMPLPPKKPPPAAKATRTPLRKSSDALPPSTPLRRSLDDCKRCKSAGTGAAVQSRRPADVHVRRYAFPNN